jgi:predicted  nucleic acid-binding Zn-ribbon protein
MSRKLRLTESELYKVIKKIIKETEDEYYRISPEDYLDVMKYASYNGNVFRKMKQYGGKPLYITGDLDLGGKDVKDIGPIAYIDGYLDIRNTKVVDLGGLQVKRYISDGGSPRERIRERQELLGKKAEMDSKRESNEWDFQNHDDEGLKAMALLEWLEGEGKLKVLDDEEKEELKTLTQQLEDLNARYDDEDRDGDPDENVEILNKIDEVQERIDELTEDVGDVYDMYPTRYSHYGLTQFEVLVDGFNGEEYTVGTYNEMDDAALKYAESYIDDIGVDGFNESFIEDYLDVDAIVNMAEEDYDYQVRDYPDSYFSDEDYELTSEQENRIAELESQISDLEQEQSELDTDREDYDELYEDFQNHIDALQEELDGIEVSTEPTEDMIENKVYELVRDVRRDPLDYLKNYGYNIKDYIDEDALAQGLIDSDGWGIMNSYDGNYDSIDIAGETYYIMRIN